MLFSTIRSFKGLEANAVLLVDVPDFNDKASTRPDLWVAFTRARLELRILTTSQLLSLQ